jgi:hypothetical protein
MRFEFKPSFDKSVKCFYGEEKSRIKLTINKLIDILSHNTNISQGLGLKRLKDNYWEVREGLKVRILFRWSGDLVEFVLAGDHNDVKRYLKNS